MHELLRYAFHELDRQRALTQRYACCTLCLTACTILLIREQRRMKREINTLKSSSTATAN